ncbi:MAG: imidazole glycerol phosphate synthase subunit HisH [Gammaproteobacteria bacterium]|nr:imidazole glycerol phosphate synthase subunit HisH [Gammaproteobacteria bacterium]|tara:strand:- start:1874 stop:2500 length:627 start_codon:yes stop_codon:yes gene_type:complete
MIAILEYGMGNTKSVENAISLLDEQVVVTSNSKIIKESDAIILPGVGSFAKGITNLHNMNMIQLLNEQVIDNKKPYLGICLGLEFLATKSFEGGENNGFNWIEGTINKIEPSDPQLKVPHMGWNDTTIVNSGVLFSEIEEPSFYYLHSYYFQVDKNEKKSISSICEYGNIPITASIQKDNIFAVQFHPEKSQNTGIKLLQNFIQYVRK